MSESEAHHFSLTSTWDPIAREGLLSNDAGEFAISHVGARPLGGKGGAVNPEELLLSGVSACFVQTWAIFIGKLQLPIDRPTVDGECVVEKDPAGGYRISRIELSPRVPAALWEVRRAEVDKTLALAEKYCIVSKAVRGGNIAFKVSPKPF